jgi:hypothetical protein
VAATATLSSLVVVVSMVLVLFFATWAEGVFSLCTFWRLWHPFPVSGFLRIRVVDALIVLLLDLVVFLFAEVHLRSFVRCSIVSILCVVVGGCGVPLERVFSLSLFIKF